MRQLALLLSLLASATVAQSQNYWELTAAGSYMLSNNFNMPEVNRPAFGVEVTWMSRTDGSKTWHRLRRRPSFGVKASFEYIIDGIAGNRFGVVGVVKAPLVSSLDYHLAIGLAYFTKPFCLTGDTNNIFISSIVSCLIDFGVDWNLTDRLFLSASFLHSSNGMLYRPNKGLNFLQAGVGYRFLPGAKAARYGVESRPVGDSPPLHYSQLGFALSHGLVMSRHSLQEGYSPCYDLSLNYQYFVGPLVAVGGTADFWYNHSHTWQLPLYRDRYPLPVYFSLQGNVEGFWGPLSIKVGVGGILLASSLVGTRLYERVGAYYNWGANYAGVGINARAGFVEFVEFSYGRRILTLAQPGRASR